METVDAWGKNVKICVLHYHENTLVCIYALFYIRALLRYNSHATQFTHLQFITQWIFIYSQSCATTTLKDFRAFPSPSPQKPVPVIPISLQPPSPRQALICFLSEWTCLSQACHINEITRHVAFCDWLLSLGVRLPRFILVVAGVRALFLFITE